VPRWRSGRNSRSRVRPVWFVVDAGRQGVARVCVWGRLKARAGGGCRGIDLGEGGGAGLASDLELGWPAGRGWVAG
jgi:hypothetical protein